MKKEIKIGLCAVLAGLMPVLGGCTSGGLDGLAASVRDESAYERLTTRSDGGYTELEIGGGVFKVVANLNDLSSRELARKVAMARSAEITKERGFVYFIVTASRSLNSCVMQGQQYLGGGPVEELTIKVLKESAGNEGGKIFEAETVLAELMPQVRAPGFTEEEKAANRGRNRMSCLTGGTEVPESEAPYLGR